MTKGERSARPTNPAKGNGRRVGRPAQPPGAQNFAQALRHAREELGLTLKEVASRAEVSPTFLSELERGSREPSLRTLDRLTAVLSLEGRSPIANSATDPASADASTASDEQLRRLAARIVLRRNVTFEELADGESVDVAVVRTAVGAVRKRLTQVGLDVLADEDQVRVVAHEPELMPASPASRQTSVPDGEPTRIRLSSPILVGREAELARLLETVRQPPSVVTIRGEAGVGKSRLVNEVLARPELTGVRRLVGTCAPVAEPFRLAPIVEAVRSDNELSSLQQSPLLGALRPLLPELAAYLPESPVRAEDPRGERHVVFRALRQLIASLTPAVLALEDLHWADEQTVDFLRFLLARLPQRLALVITYREEDLPRGSSVIGLTARPSPGVTTSTIDLQPLPAPDVQRLVAAILDTDEVTEEFARQLHTRTSGVPFAVEEVIRLVRDRDGLVHAGGAMTQRALDALEVPSNIRDFVLERAGRLDQDARAVVDAAAVLGTAASEDLLRTVLGWTATRTTEAVRRALDAAVLFDVDDHRVALRHPLANQAIHAALATPLRRRMHLRAATALEKTEPRPVAQLARHYREADRQDRWRMYAEQAADRAGANGDQATAAAGLAELLATDGAAAQDRARMAIKLGTAALSAHTLQHDAVELLADVIADRRISATQRGQIRSRIGQLMLEIGESASGTRELITAATELRRRPDSAAIVMGNLALPSVEEGSERDHRRWLSRAIAVADKRGDTDLSLLIASIRVLVLLYYGDPAGWAAMQELPRNSASITTRRQLLWLDAHVMGACFHLGHYDRARTHLAEAERRATELGWGRYLPLRETTMLLLDWAVGDWDSLSLRARRYADDMAVEHPLGELLARVIVGHLALARGELDAAEQCLRRVLDEATRVGGVLPLIPLAAGGLARIWLSRGDAHAAWEVTRPALAMVAHKEIWVWAAEVAPIATRALAMGGRVAEARTLARDLAAHLSGRDAPLARAARELCDGEVALGVGDLANGAAAMLRAQSMYAALPRPYDAALAGVRAGETLFKASDERAAVVLLDSLAELERLGATADAGRTRRMLRRRGVPLRRGWGGGRQPYGRQLSPREEEVARLVAQGYSNADIGEALFLAPKTIEHHISSVFRKLGVRSRASFLAMWLAEHQQAPAKLGDRPN